MEAQHCVLGHPKPNWILSCANEEINPSLVGFLSLKLSPPSANLSQLATKVLQKRGSGGHVHERKTPQQSEPLGWWRERNQNEETSLAITRRGLEGREKMVVLGVTWLGLRLSRLSYMTYL
jgi:hypothetical protein